MRISTRRVVVAAGLVLGFASTALAEPEYDFYKIDSFNANPLAGETFVWDVNDAGVVVGEATMDNRIGYPGFKWTVETGKIEIPVTGLKGISNTGFTAGLANIHNYETNQTWSPSALPGTYYSPRFGDINDAGLAVGTISGCSCSDSGGVTYVPYLWDQVNGAHSMPFPIPNAKGLSRINNNGVALGWLNGFVAGGWFFTDLNTGAYTLLADVVPPTLGVGVVGAADINDNGDVLCGRAGTFPVYRYSFIYSPDGNIHLLPFPGAGYQQQVSASGINNSRTVVGSITNEFATQFAFVYNEATGLRNLNNPAIVANIPAGYTMRSAMKVSNSGWIIGNGTQGNKNTGWSLKPRGVVCNSIDFNNDGSFFDPQDIDAFLSVYSEGPCVPDTATCDDIDFNNDTSVFDPCDIDSFLLMYSEGPCAPCGG
ncbi:MAG: hypothetical protein U0640_10590 [Phycisphaerales bacterium]